MERPLGVKYLAVVSFSAAPLLMGMMVCTEPLPNVFVPMTIARPLSCRAPATISDAEAEPPLTSTTMGAPSSVSLGVAVNFSFESATRPSV